MHWTDIFVFVLGVFLLVAYTEIVKSIDNEIGFDSSAARSIQGIYTIGIIFIMDALYSLSGYQTEVKGVPLVMEIFLILLGIVLIVLSSIILDKTKNMKDKRAKNWSIALITGGSLMLVVSLARIGYGYYKNQHKVGPVKYIVGQNHVELPGNVDTASSYTTAPTVRHAFSFF